MFLSLNEITHGDMLEADICIVGGGAAGITIALELENSGKHVLLLESGGFDFDADTQDLYIGENIGLDYHPLDIVRLRYFGGTTNHWGGRCWAFRPIDFERRDWIEASGWPFSRADLEPFYVRAQPYLDLGRFGYTPEELGDDRPADSFGDGFDTLIAQSSSPTRFGEAYRDRLAAATRIRVVLHANATAIRSAGAGNPVTAIRAVSLQGRQVTVRAPLVVLAAGGLEVPRLLLQPTETHPNGVGNGHDLVGRYFADHLVIDHAGELLLHESPPGAELFESHRFKDAEISRFFAPSADTQRREELLQSRLELLPLVVDQDAPGVEALRHLRDEAARGSWPEGFLSHLAEVARDLDTVVAYAYRRLTDPPPRYFRLQYHAEPEPFADSRIILGSARDALGMQRIRLDWQITERVRHTYTRTLELLAQSVGSRGQGRLRVSVEPERFVEEMRASFHPMGATRMHDNPRLGVVDRDARVHEVPNLYIAGSSVFPTYGQGSPTLTIVALAIRLADHLLARAA